MNTIKSNGSLSALDRDTGSLTLQLSQDAPSSKMRRNEHAAWPRHHSSFLHFRHSTITIVFMLLACCLSSTSASSPLYIIEEEMVEAGAQVPTTWNGQILVDPVWASRNKNHAGQGLRPRDDPVGIQLTENLVKRTTSSMITTTSSTKTSSSSKSTSTSSSATAVATGDSTTSLPTPFDQGFSTTTSSCSAFIQSFLANATFKSCLPFSLLLQNSISFFQAEKSPLRISETLDATCAANVNTCTAYMSSLASNLTTSANCATDLKASNPAAQQALLGLNAYAPMYTASCLRNPTTSSYCFADAVTNASSPTDPYVYYLPVNVTLPGGSQPTCDSCLKNTMAVFQQATADRKSSIAGDYVASAQQINVVCGPGFVNATLAAAVTTSGSSHTAMPLSSTGLLALAAVVCSWFL